MRKDEYGNDCPATLGEYRQGCVLVGQMKGVPDNKAMQYLDRMITLMPKHEDHVVTLTDAEMRRMLFPMCLEAATPPCPPL